MELLSCKRGKAKDDDPVQSISSAKSITDLQDDLQVRILTKLPSQFAVQCKTVCKRWLSLISDRYFIRESVHGHHHHRFNNSNFTIMIRFLDFTRPAFSKYEYYLSSNTIKGGDVHTGLQYLNSLEVNNDCPSWQIHAVAYFNDLLLCAESPGVYYICNPLTKQQLKLPPAPATWYDEETPYIEGFVCCPYSCDGKQICSTNVRYTYKVVLVSNLRSEDPFVQFQVEIFDSDSGKWSEFVVTSPSPLRGFYRYCTVMVAYNGVLHWIDGDDKIIAYDPVNNINSCRVIDLPMNEFRGSRCVGVSGGSMRMCELSIVIPPYKLMVWELEDYNGGKWSCVKNVMVKQIDIVWEDFGLHENPRNKSFLIHVIGFHPCDTNIVYLNSVDGIIYSCDIRTGRLELISKKYNNEMRWNWAIFPLLHPWWPTPVPPLPSDDDNKRDSC